MSIYSVTVLDSSGQLVDDYDIYLVDASSGNISLTTPDAGNNGTYISLKRIDTSSNSVTVYRAGSQLIDGVTSFTLAQWEHVTLLMYEGNWYRIFQ